MSQTDNNAEPPDDDEQRAVIDKLASFVARNGTEFENMTKEKQNGNAQFAFLFGGDYSEYYLSRVEEIRRSLPQYQPPPPQIQQQQPHAPFHSDSSGPPPSWGGGPPYSSGWVDDRGGPWPIPPHGNWGGGGSVWPPNGTPGWGPYGAPPPPFYPHAPPSLSEEDIKRSEDNLKAQFDKIMSEEKPAAVRRCQDESRMEAFTIRARALDITPEDVSAVIQPLIDLCTKENIAKGKNWTVEQMSKSVECADLVADYLLARVGNAEATFELRLHIVYLLNDLLHYLKRRAPIPHFTDAVNRVVVPIFCFAMELADEAKQGKLIRVLTLWETNAYVPEDVLKYMKEKKDRDAFMKEWHEEQSKAFAEKIASVESEYQARYESLKKQHDEFAEHVHNTMAAEAERNATEPEGRPTFPDFTRFGPPPPYGPWGGGSGGPGFDPHWPDSRGPPPPFMGGPPTHPSRIGGPGDRWDRRGRDDMPPYHHPYPDDDFYDSGRRGPPFRGPQRDRIRRDGPPARFDDDYRDDRRYRGGLRRSRYSEDRDGEKNDTDNSSSRWSSDNRRSTRSSRDSPRGGSSWHHRDDSPQPLAAASSSPQQAVTEEDLIPKAPFWQLPAGLMVPLIEAAAVDFVSLDPSKLRLLPPEPPREQLMQALDTFYSAPAHDRPRDAEGWEKQGLFEFYRSKEAARARKDSGGDEANSPSSASPTAAVTSPPPATNTKSNGLAQLAYLTAYPKSAIGQAIRTGPAALIGIPPPTMLLPKMNAQFAAAAAAASKGFDSAKTENNQPIGGAIVPPPPGFAAFPPPGMLGGGSQTGLGTPTQQPTTMVAPPTQLIARATRFTSTRRRSRSHSRSPRSRSTGSRSEESRSRSRSLGSRGSRSSSRSRSRSHSSSPGRWRDRSRSRSSSPRSSRGRPSNRSRDDGSITTAGFMRRGGGGGDRYDNRSPRRAPDYPPSWDYEAPPPTAPMMSAFDRPPGGRGMRGGPAPPMPPSLGHPPPQMYPPFGGGYRGNGYGAPPPMGGRPRGGFYYGSGGGDVMGGGGDYPYGNGGGGRRGGGGYQGR